MTRSEFVFWLIDVLFYPFQNYKHYDGVVREKDIVFDSNIPDVCKGDVYYKAELMGPDKPKMPVVLNIHGGGFEKGDKNYRVSLGERFADQGYFVWNINYRLAKKYKIPCGHIDCVNALNYLEVLAEKYNIDLTKVCVTGDSAGGYYAGMLTALAFDDNLCKNLGTPEVKVKPALLVGGCGIYDFLETIKQVKLPFHLVWDIGRCAISDDKFQLKKDLSNLSEYPLLEYVSSAPYINDKWCPAFLYIAKKDMFCRGQGEYMEGKLKELNIEVDSYITLKQNHCFHLNFWDKESKTAFKQMFDFMEKHLKN